MLIYEKEILTSHSHHHVNSSALLHRFTTNLRRNKKPSHKNSPFHWSSGWKLWGAYGWGLFESPPYQSPKPQPRSKLMVQLHCFMIDLWRHIKWAKILGTPFWGAQNFKAFSELRVASPWPHADARSISSHIYIPPPLLCKLISWVL